MITIGKKVRLIPTKEQEQKFLEFSGASRFAWNICKTYCEVKFWSQGKYSTKKELRDYIHDLKHNDPNYAWLNNIPEAIPKQAIDDLLHSYKKYFLLRKKHGVSINTPDKYKPKFKSKKNVTQSFYQRTDKIHKVDDTHIKITGIDKPVNCPMLKGIELPKKIHNPRVTFNGKYWFLSYTHDEESPMPINAEREALGIDIGLKEFVISSNGKHYRNINKDEKMKKLEKRLKRTQRQLARKQLKNTIVTENGKKLCQHTNNIDKATVKVHNLFAKISNIKTTYIHEVVKDLVKTKPSIIIMEDLNYRFMSQNPKLANAIRQQSFSLFKRILSYKCEWNGIDLKYANRFYPSSKKCSSCGNIKHDLKLYQRIYHCDICGLIMDRDENAALNLEKCSDFKK